MWHAHRLGNLGRRGRDSSIIIGREERSEGTRLRDDAAEHRASTRKQGRRGGGSQQEHNRLEHPGVGEAIRGAELTARM